MIAMMLMAIVTACGKSNGTQQPDSSAKVPGETAAAGEKGSETKQLVMFAADHPDVIDPIKDKIGEFEKSTGIKVRIETVPESQRLTKANLILSSGSADYDVFVSGSVELAGIVQAGWYEPIDKLLTQDFDFSDFPPLLIDLLKQDGALYGLPIRAETNIMMYREDIFKEKGIAVPTTMDEMVQTASKMKADTGLFGTALRGDPGQSGYSFTYFLKSMGGHFFDKDMNPTLNSPEAIKALEMYVELNTKYAPKGASTYTWDQVFGSVQSGNVGMIVESSIQAGILEDPNKSKVVGKIGYAVPPAGPAGAKPDMKTYGYSISKFSENKEAAAKFIEWATSKEIQQYAFDKYGVAALTRTSVMDYAQTKAPYFQAIKETMGIGDIYYLPSIAELGSVYTATCEAVSAALAKTETPEQALNKANDKIKQIITDAGYFSGKKPIPQFIKDGNS
jgi:multiple sugar transport system substrate-binding protein